MKVAALALAANSNLKQFIIAERAPRADKWKALNEYANEELFEAVKNVENEDVRKRIVVGRHNLETVDSGLQKARFGDPRVRGVDGIHMRGSSGQIALTRSMAAILAGAGLCSTQDAYNVGRCQENQLVAPALALAKGYQVQRGLDIFTPQNEVLGCRTEG